MSETQIHKGIAFFDFDGTLIHGDSLLPFLAAIVGWPRLLFFFCVGILKSFFRGPVERRTFIKDYMLHRALCGRSKDDIARAVAKLAAWPRWISSSVEALRRHKNDGYRIVIASGSLDLYLKDLVKDLPVDDILCTEMAWDKGRLTGAMASGNCVRQNKAARVKAYMDTHGPFAESWAYGNAPHDLPMMAHVKNKVVI